MKIQTKNVFDIVEEYFCTMYKINKALSSNVFGFGWFEKLENKNHSSNYRELPYPNKDFIANLFYINPREFNATLFVSREDLIRRLNCILPPYPIHEPYVNLNSTGEYNIVDEHLLMLFERNRLINNLTKKYKSISSEIEFIEERKKESSEPINRERVIKFWTNESKCWCPGCSDEEHKRNAIYEYNKLKNRQFRESNDLEGKYKELNAERAKIKNNLSQHFFNLSDVEFSKLDPENRIIIKYLIDSKNINEIKKFLEKANIDVEQL